jgi:hypothetical protein
MQETIVFVAAIMGGAKSPEASKALVDFLRTPVSAGVIKAKGMEPASRWTGDESARRAESGPTSHATDAQ